MTPATIKAWAPAAPLSLTGSRSEPGAPSESQSSYHQPQAITPSNVRMVDTAHTTQDPIKEGFVALVLGGLLAFQGSAPSGDYSDTEHGGPKLSLLW